MNSQMALQSSRVTDVSYHNFHTLVSKFLSQSTYLYLTVVYYALFPRAQTTTLQCWRNQGPTRPHGVLPQFFFGVINLPYTYKLFCYWTFGLRAKA